MQIDRGHILGLALTVLTVLAAIQAGHNMVEIGLIALGITVGPKGILGFVFPLIWLHFFLNLITLTLMLWSLGSMWRAARRAGGGMVPLPAPAHPA